MSFNVLADIYATEKAYPYVQKRFLRWDYRCEIVLNEIARYRSHVVCLQEVQYSHYCNFFSKQLMLYNYEGIFKKKTRTSLYSDPNAVDGCALFFDKSVFRLVQQFTIEFNEAADELFRDSDGPRKEIVRRLARDNVALVCTLEDLRTKRRVCVANTHIFWDPLYEDVKLWQTFVLCKEIQSKLLFGNSSNEQKYPIIICGDFNSTPDSQVYGLLTKGIVDLNAQLFKNDKLGIFSNTKIEHSQPFESAYKEVLNKEPSYTNYTESFKGCLDYLLFSKGSLEVLKVLDCYPENVLKEHLALPSPRFASDHIQLVAEFAFGAE
ncbi:hypothetical protein MHBO_001138 [Bonamia ostreae]|uniref:Endonuclease/exonuclease/phosphatase domain-containing protein n=1 Tax=Bonamia ostreae TaxID=126728 RepID=A0ABV2AHW8_9EUKA